MNVECWFDGSTEPVNPNGHTSYGALILCGGKTLLAKSGYVGVGEGMTNNVGEYAGIISVMEFLIANSIKRATIYGDSKMVVYQLNGQMKAKRGAYMPYYRRAIILRSKLPDVVIKWIPREQNTRADYLSRQAIKTVPRSESEGRELKSLIQQQREDRHDRRLRFEHAISK